MIARSLTPAILAALSDTPVVLLQGARQCGKSTLAQALAAGPHPARYFTLDDSATFAAASADPDGFIQNLPGPVIIDEIQLAPALFRAIKTAVDRDRAPGRFFLTGSANVLLLPKASESLAGRMQILTLWPLSQAEIEGTSGELIDRLFASGPESLSGRNPQAALREDLARRLTVGGYPEVIARRSASRRHDWFEAYLTTMLMRDVRAMADIDGLSHMPHLTALLATHSGGLLNVADLARDVGGAQPTLKRHLTLLQATHLYHPLPAWSGNARKRLIKREKTYLNDTGTLCFLRGVDADFAASVQENIGPLVESFVFQELSKQIGWSRTRPKMYYFRTADGAEVDFVLEDRRGHVVGIEAKSSMRLVADDFSGLRELAAAVGKKIVGGIVLYPGSALLPFGDKLWAVPLSALWNV